MENIWEYRLFNPASKVPSYYFVDFILFKGAYPYTFYFREVSVVDLFSPNKAHYFFRIPGLTMGEEVMVEELEGVWSKCENRPFVVNVIHQAMKKYYGPLNFFFAMGKKSGFLQRFIKFPVFNLEFHGCPSIEELQRTFLIEDRNKAAYCRHHILDWPMPCARLNAYCVKNWVLENAEKINMLNHETRLATFKEWISVYDPLPLAVLGFIHINGTRGVICIFCRLYREDVPSIAQLMEEHALLFVAVDHKCQ